MNIKTAALIPAVASVAIATATVAFADSSSDGDSGVSSVDAQGTVTVTATVAPDQCQPVAGGPESAPVTDTAGEPVDPQSPSSDEEDASTDQSTGAHTSRFDPYTCAPVPVSAETSASTETVRPIPSYEAPLQPYPAGGSEVSGGVPNQGRGPLSEPTTSSTLPPMPAPAAPGQ